MIVMRTVALRERKIERMELVVADIHHGSLLFYLREKRPSIHLKLNKDSTGTKKPYVGKEGNHEDSKGVE